MELKSHRFNTTFCHSEIKVQSVWETKQIQSHHPRENSSDIANKWNVSAKKCVSKVLDWVIITPGTRTEGTPLPPTNSHTHTHSCTLLPILFSALTLSLTPQFFIINIYTNSLSLVSLRTSAHPHTYAHIHKRTHAQNRASIIDTFPSTLSKNNPVSIASWCPPSQPQQDIMVGQKTMDAIAWKTWQLH